MWRQVHRDTDTIWFRALPMGRLQGRLGNLLLQRQTGSDCCLQVGFLSRGGTGSFCSWLILLQEGTDGLQVPGSEPFCIPSLHGHLLRGSAVHCLPTPTLSAHSHTALWKSLFGCNISSELWPDTLVTGWSITAEVFLVLLVRFSLTVVNLLSPHPLQPQLYFRLLAFLRFYLPLSSMWVQVVCRWRALSCWSF